MTRFARNRKAFTLLELVVVMLLLTLMAAVVVPRLSGFVMGRKVDEETRRFVALTRFAREEAISRGERLSLLIDADGKHYSLHPAEDSDTAIVSYDCEEKLTIVPADDEESAGEASEILFWPDGTIDPDSPTDFQLAEDGVPTFDLSFDEETAGFTAERISDEE